MDIKINKIERVSFRVVTYETFDFNQSGESDDRPIVGEPKQIEITNQDAVMTDYRVHYNDDQSVDIPSYVFEEMKIDKLIRYIAFEEGLKIKQNRK